MKAACRAPPSHARLCAGALALVLVLAPVLLMGVAWAEVQEVTRVSMLTTPDATPPGAQRAWQPVTLPDIWRRSRPQVRPAVTWYRIPFVYPDGAAAGEPWAVYFPYLYDGGQVWLNGTLTGSIATSNEKVHVRWARPHLVTLPMPLLRPGNNELMVRAGLPPLGGSMHIPRISIGPQTDLVPVHEWRFFWVNTVPVLTAAVCLLVAMFVLFIWWRRPSEVLYGLFGAAAGLWGIRTLIFVIEMVPVPLWPLWRLTYLSATGGFIVMMALIALRLGEIRKPWIERALILYWLIGPAWLAAGGLPAEPQVSRYWVGGFIPIGIAILGVSVWTVWRQRTLKSAVMPAAMTLAVIAGIHDYAIDWSLAGVTGLLPTWTGHRVFLLHYGADLVLMAMGGLLTARFLQALSELQEMNQTLESRVAERERELSENYVRMAALQREHAAAQERQLIMRDLHDGLGSQLFTSLLRVERGDLQSAQVADALRGCIADMRLALDTLTPNNHDFRATLGDFLFRWQSQLAAAGIRPAWTIDVPDAALQLSPHAALQVLRIAQEALTNVLKHAHASRVEVRLRQAGEQLGLEVRDDGAGFESSRGPAGRGLGNMRTRARQLGGQLEVHTSLNGTCIALQLPVKAVLA